MCKSGQITKREIPALLQQLDEWQARMQQRIDALAPEFKAWGMDEIAELRQRVESQDYWFAVQSTVKHIALILSRMERGEIVSVKRDELGSSFTLTAG